MDDTFDPYRKWLGIAQEEQPPHHYRLLGINLFENDPDVIDSAADRQMAHVRTFQTGQHSEESQKILNELAAARVCLLDSDKKAAYDAELQAEIDKKRPEEDTEAANASISEQSEDKSTPLYRNALGAVQYLWVISRLFWLLRVQLSGGYRQLGQEIYRDDRYRGRLPETHEELDALSHSLAALQRESEAAAGESSEEQPEPEDQEAVDSRDDDPEEKEQSKEKTKNPRPRPRRLRRLVGWAVTKFRAVLMVRRRRALFRRLGRAAYEMDADRSGPEELTKPIGKALVQREAFRARVAQLSMVPPGEFFSPKRLAWVFVGIAVFLSLFFCWLSAIL